MEEITVTQNGFDCGYMSYLYTKVRERFSFLPATCDLLTDGEYAEISFRTEREYCPYVRRFVEENLADVVAVGYKYAFFQRRLALPLLSAFQKYLLCTALVAADYQDDKNYARKRLQGEGQYSIDGAFHFRLRELQRRWEGIAEYVPTEMSVSSLDGFLEFLTEDGEGKLFLKGGKVYDEEYRPLTRSALTGQPSAVGEILLGCAKKVYCFGETDKETEAFLRKYYQANAIFC